MEPHHYGVMKFANVTEGLEEEEWNILEEEVIEISTVVGRRKKILFIIKILLLFCLLLLLDGYLFFLFC
jgi:hypothetical protein